MRPYPPVWIRGSRELIAGISLAALVIPERVSHAYLAGLWPRIGLYSSIAAALAYAGFRRSRFLVAGTNPSLALLLSASIAPVAAQDPLLAAAMASATALMAGVLALGAWVLRLGLLSKAMSDHVLIGFNMGAGALVIVGQVPQVVAGWGNLAVGAGTLGVLLLGERVLPGRPTAALLMLLALVVAQVVYLPALGIQLVRTAPPGSLWAPWHAAARVPWAQLVPLTVAVFVLSYVQDVSCAREVAAQGASGAPNVSPDAELLANGATNVGTGLVGGMPVAASTPLEGSMDSPSVRVLVVSGAVTLLVVMLFSVTLADLPMAMLAANLIRHAGHLIGAGMRGLAHTPRRQLVATLATALSVMTLGPLNGMLIAVALTLLGRPWKRVESTHP